MMKKGAYPDKASPDLERMARYKRLASAFSYPDDEGLSLEYDRLFRSGKVWLYGAEYTSENEFQRAKALADINGFYKAFGVEPDRDRPDSISAELEFMRYLIFKAINAPDEEKASICRDAARKFFAEHLHPAGNKMAEKIISIAGSGFYKDAATELLKFLNENQPG